MPNKSISINILLQKLINLIVITIIKNLSKVNVINLNEIIKRLPIVILLVVGILVNSYSQNTNRNDSPSSLTLEQCINYAIQHQPDLNQSLINIEIAKTTNAINLSGWLPQLNVSGNLTHYYQLPTTLATNPIPDGQPIPTHTGIVNTANPEVSISETIFNPQLLYSAKIANLYVKQAEQNTDVAKINLVTNVSKSFYNLLFIFEQINVLIEDTARLNRNISDTYHQYEGGLVDETDYEQAKITYNNSLAQLKQQINNISPAYASLKQLIGYPPDKQFNVTYDTLQMMKEIVMDTTQLVNYDKRIEYQQLQTDLKLQHQLTNYYKLSILPTLSVNYNYFYEYENNSFSNLFNNAYPYSYLGLSLNIPVFTGFARMENIHKSKLQEKNLEWTEISLKSQINSEYATALANYKSNLFNWSLLKENETRAKNVYNIVSLQYQQGIVAYLNMIVAESNLITAEIGYKNAMFQLLSSKIDLQKAIGIIPLNH